MKKLIAILLCLAMTVSMAACGAAPQQAETQSPAGETQAAETADESVLKGVTYTTVTEGMDWGPAVTKVILNPGVELDGASVTADKFNVLSSRTYPDVDYIMWTMSAPYAHQEQRTVTAAYLSDEAGSEAADGAYITLELAVGPELEEGSPFWFNVFTNMNEYVEINHIVTTTAPLMTKDGREISIANTWSSDNLGNATVLADDFDATGAYTYTYDGGKREIDLTYASWFPQENAAAGSTPLVIWLHGMGEGGENPYVAILGNKVVNLITEDIQKNFGETGAAVLAPQTPTMWLDTSGTGNMAMGTANSESFYTEALMSLIVDFVKAHPEIDPTRLYIGGCSNGGFMTVNMLMNYPGAFAAAYPVCVPYYTDWMTDEKIEALAQHPIWFTAAKNDSAVVIYDNGEYVDMAGQHYALSPESQPIDEHTFALVRRLQEAGAKDVRFTLFDDVRDMTGLYNGEDGQPYQYSGHWSWLYTLNNECTDNGVTVFEWLAQQTGEGKLPELPLEKTVYENPITFYLVRHGETEFNTQGIMQGWTDSPLTQNGIDLSKKLGEGLADVDFVAAYSSDSGRAVDTANNVLEGRDVELTQNEDLREMYFGVVDGQSSEGVYTEENIGYRFGVGFDDLGGETWEGLGQRMHAALELAALEHREEGGSILISTHGMSILAALYALVPDAPGVMEQGEIDNCSVTILEWDNGVYTLKTLNDTSYLD